MESATSHRKRSNGYRHRHSSHGSPAYENRKERHRHKSSHKRRRHKTRSRSLSDSNSVHDRKAPVVYMNPAFQQVYGSSGIVPTQPEMEIPTHIHNHYSAYERISSLESELRAAQLARGRAEQAIYDVNAEKCRIESQNAEILQIMKTLEKGVEDLQNELLSMNEESERRRVNLENIEKTFASCREQNKFLSERNMKLVKKCEELATENKSVLGRRDESARELAEVRPRIEALQAEIRSRSDENRKLSMEMRGFEDKERVWRKEKMDLEKRIEIKDATAAAERKNYDDWKKRFMTEKTELERKVKLAEPEINRALNAETLKKAIEDVRAFYEEKLSNILSELESLKKKASKEKTGLSPNTSCNEKLDLKKSASSELECRSSSAPPSSLINGLPSLSKV